MNPRQLAEKLARRPKDYAEDGVITGIFGDTVHVRVAGAGRQVVTNVYLSDHIRKEALYIGLFVKISGLHHRDGGRRGHRMVTAILPQLSPPSFAYSAVPLPPELFVSVNCDGGEWLLNWTESMGAMAYEVYWALDEEGVDQALLGVSTLREYSVAFDQTQPPRTFFAVKAVGPTADSELSAWTTDLGFMTSAPLIAFGDGYEHGHVLNLYSNYKSVPGLLPEDPAIIEWSTNEAVSWDPLLLAELPPGVTLQKIAQAEASYYYSHRHSARFRVQLGKLERSLDAGVTWQNIAPPVTASPWGDTPLTSAITYCQVLSRSTVELVTAEVFNSGAMALAIQLSHAQLQRATELIIRPVGGLALIDDASNYRIDYGRGRVRLLTTGTSAEFILPNTDYEIDYGYHKHRLIVIGRWEGSYRGLAWFSSDQYGRVWEEVPLKNSGTFWPIWAALTTEALWFSFWDGYLKLSKVNLETGALSTPQSFGVCTKAELDARTYYLFPVTVPDDPTLIHVAGRFRTYPGEPTELEE